MRTLILCLILLSVSARAALPDAGLGDSDKVRFHHLCQKLIAPCCWTQSVDIHSSPAADQARIEVVALIRDGKSDREILDSFIKRYGIRILAEPEGMKSVVLTTVPIVLLTCGLGGLGWFLLRQRKRTSAATPQGDAPDLISDSEWE